MIISAIFPRRCPVCDEIVPGGELIHPKCKKKLKTVSGNTCYKCGKPLSEESREYCSDCASTKHIFDRNFALYKYRSIAGSVYKFKYSGRREYADFYAAEIVKRFGDELKALKPDALIPVPMYGPKKRTRGYNQAEVLAVKIGKNLGIPVDSRIIKRCKKTVPMKLLDEQGRMANLKKAFNIAQNEVKYKCIILIDDIYTTGSTLDAVAAEFRRMGVKNIYCVTLAIGQVV
ncbi:MAG: ComF family protein [Butyrivibrio sp.]|nr:ComF family protein [Butyrivibrio sp.]